eukprot:354496-Chlamydomonas_euryale.AAC.2
MAANPISTRSPAPGPNLPPSFHPAAKVRRECGRPGRRRRCPAEPYLHCTRGGLLVGAGAIECHAVACGAGCHSTGVGAYPASAEQGVNRGTHLKELEANQSTARTRAEQSSAASQELLQKLLPHGPILCHAVPHAVPQDTQRAQRDPHTINPAPPRAAGQKGNIV